MSDSTITAVANGGSPQPVAIQPASPTSKEDFKKVADQVVAGEAADNVDLDEAEAAIEAAEAEGEISKKEAQVLKKKLKLKVDGEEIEKEINFEDDEDLKKHFQKSLAFDKRTKEFSGFKNQVDELLKQLKENPEALLEKMGYDVDGMAEKRLARKLEELEKSPEQLEREKMNKELEELRKAKQDADKENERIHMEKLRNQAATEIENEIQSALDSTKTKLPKNNPHVLEKIAKSMVFAMNNGYPNVTVKDVIPIVEKQWQDELRSYFDTSAEDMIEELVGKTNIDRMRKKRLANRANTKTATQTVKDTGRKNKDADRDDDKPKKSYKQLFSYHDE